LADSFGDVNNFPSAKEHGNEVADFGIEIPKISKIINTTC